VLALSNFSTSNEAVLDVLLLDASPAASTVNLTTSIPTTGMFAGLKRAKAYKATLCPQMLTSVDSALSQFTQPGFTQFSEQPG
jgi:hypothetical protein